MKGIPGNSIYAEANDKDGEKPLSRLKVLALINARGNSKGIPRKNIKPLLGKPLIAYSIEAAQASKLIDKVIVSTDDTEIAEISRKFGAEVPFLRPEHLATDDAPQLKATEYAIGWLREHWSMRPEILILLQPTAPLRTTTDIDQALKLLIETRADSVVSFTTEAAKHPYYMYTMEDGRPRPFVDLGNSGLQRQSFPKVFVRNGAIYALRASVVTDYGNVYGSDCRAYMMPPERSINIDNEFDWTLAEFILRKK